MIELAGIAVQCLRSGDQMRMRILSAVLVLGAVHLALGQTPSQSCAALKKMGFADTEILQSTVVEAGKLDLGQEHPDEFLRKLPAFCRVVASARPSADSHIKIEVWMPLTGWNGRFIGQGNGGFAGTIGYQGLAVALLAGFASAGTDTGHSGGATDSGWALGHPEKIVDFGYRGVHSMTEFSKAAVKAFYAGPAKHNYFSSCSDGGREALMEAQRFPADYDGILAGAPAYNWTDLLSRGTELSKEIQLKPETYLSPNKVPAINKAVLAACKRDEPADFLADPRACHFSPDTMVCKGPETDARLKDGELVYHGLLPGGELGDNGWPGWITGDKQGGSEGNAYGVGYFRNLVYSDPNWELKNFDLDRDLKAAEAKTAPQVNAVNPDLRPFQARGGKLILYHGWNDPAISPLGTVDYVASVQKVVGSAETQSFLRLFLVPGMQHCGGGPGPAAFGQWGPTFTPALDDAAHNITTALVDWVEKSSAPEQVIARGNTDATGKGKGVAFSQPICAYPKAAVYTGSGDRKEAASYVCGVN
jgi:hypothetical protein